MMKKYISTVFICLGLVTFSLNHAFAQDDEFTKQMAKEWKKKAKNYVKNPRALKTLVDDNESLNSQVSSLKSKNQSFQSQLSDKDAKISELQDDMTKLRRDLSAAKSQAKKAPESNAEPRKRQDLIDGVVFKVQIGAFRNKDLSKYFENHENFSGENDEDGLQKITLGQFRDYWEADTFKKYLREMGVKDAWIVPYKDGVRVPIKDVLEGVMTTSEG